MKVGKIEIYMVPGQGETEQDNPPRVITIAQNRVDGVKYPNEVKMAYHLLEWIDRKA